MSINEPDIKPVVGKVSYLIRLRLGEYEHEELCCELTSNPESPVAPEALMARCRRICIENTTQFKKGNK